MKVLINAPKLSKGGGVSIYWSTIFDKLNLTDARLFCVGGQKKKEFFLEKLYRLFKDYYAFYYTVKHYDLVLINPSLQINAVIRDALFILIAKARSKKVISFFHGWDPKFEARLTDWIKSIFTKIFFSSDALIVLSSEFKKKIVAWGCNKPIFVESTAIAYNPLPTGKLVHNIKKTRLLFLSRIEKDKGIYELFDIFKEIKKENSDVELVVAGNGSELGNCRDYINSENIEDVRLLGFVTGSKKEEVFSLSDIFVLPTRHGEGMPISILEAMFYKLPIITMKVGGLKDFFKNGEMGYAFEQYDIRSMQHEIKKLISDKKQIQRIGASNRAFAIKYFCAPSVAKRINDIIRFVYTKQGNPKHHWYNP